MIDLNNPSSFKHLDPKDVYGSTGLFIDQCDQIWNDSMSLSFPSDYKNVQNILLCGMGGSAYSGYIINSLYKNELKIPLISNNDYDLPEFADKDTLVILSSYSGNTEECLSAGQIALKKNLKITGITSGGELSLFYKTNNFPYLLFDPKNNPSAQPRVGLGYMIFGTLALLAKLNILNLTDEEAEESLSEARENMRYAKNEAIEISQKLKGFFPIIMSSTFLNGNAHVLRNQFNETSKSFAVFEDIPELNHHLLEGFKYPKELKTKVLFLNSELYDEKYKKRIALTEDVLSKNNIESIYYNAIGSTKLSQCLNVLSFGGYLSFYLGILYGEDPSLIPWVDYFKEKLSH